TMLMAVTERVREIGLKKAVGAHTRHILREYLLEATLIGAIGGTIGLLLGWGITSLVNAATAASNLSLFLVSWRLVIIAIVFSVGLGAVAGIIPALRASRMDPVRALRAAQEDSRGKHRTDRPDQALQAGLDRRQSARRRQPEHRVRRIRLNRRSLREREDDGAGLAGPPASADKRAGDARRHRYGQTPGRRPRRPARREARLRLPGVQPAPRPERAAERHAAAPLPQKRQGWEGTRHHAARRGRPEGPHAPPAGPDVGRRAAAGGHRPIVDQPAVARAG